jgi:predicted RNase H-like nuclease (RuvC/YqgF family)
MSDITKGLAENVLRLGNECRILAEENIRLEQEITQLRRELADIQESYHLLNETLAKLIRKTTK